MNKLLENTNNYVKQIQKQFYHKKRWLKTASLIYSYHIVNPLLAVDAISQVELSYRSQAGAINTRKYIHQRQYFPSNLQFFREIHEIDVDGLRTKLLHKFPRDQPVLLTPTDSTPINFLVALSGRPSTFIRFLQNFEEAFLSSNENVNLIVSFFPKKDDDDDDRQSESDNELIVKSESDQQYEEQSDPNSKAVSDVEFIRNTIDSYQSKHPKRSFKLIILEKGTAFSRGIGLQEASKDVKNGNEILFFCDVDLVFAPDMLNHIRRNTVRGEKVYYPVFFSQFDPDVVYVEKQHPPTHFSFEELDGFWRYFSFGMLSIYKSDFARTIGFNTKIQGWGLEDVEMVTYLRIKRSRGNAYVSKAGGLRIKSRAGQIGHRFANGLPPAVTYLQKELCYPGGMGEDGPRQLTTCFSVMPALKEI